MAKPKYDWAKIKKDYDNKVYSSTQDLAKAYDIPYGYLRKKVAKWNQDNTSISQIKNAIKDINTQTEITLEKQSQFILTDYEDKVPSDRASWHKRLYDKLGVIVEAALDNPELNFFNNNGQVKTKALSDMASIIQTIQKGQEQSTEDKANGQLQAYADMISSLKAIKK
jgi:hypothetical protein